MMRKDTVNPPDSSPSPGALTIKEHDPATRTTITLDPTVQAALTVDDYYRYGTDLKLDVCALSIELSLQEKAAKAGDLTRAEAMLIAQAHTLDAIFNNLVRRAARAQHVDPLLSSRDARAG